MVPNEILGRNITKEADWRRQINTFLAVKAQLQYFRLNARIRNPDLLYVVILPNGLGRKGSCDIFQLLYVYNYCNLIHHFCFPAVRCMVYKHKHPLILSV